MIIKVPNTFPYQGSKRALLHKISRYINICDRIVEPFAGSAAVSLFALSKRRAASAWINDLNAPLMGILREVVENPEGLANEYEQMWKEQLGREKEYYIQTRTEFNETQDSRVLLFLLARCVKGAVRYNSNGDFNQSPDNRRLGRNPKMMRRDIMDTHRILNGRVVITHQDYRDVLMHTTPNDLVYLDPPYQGVCTGSDDRYFASINHQIFVDALRDLTHRGIRYVVSYDGRTGTKIFGETLPIEELGLQHIEIDAGRSSQSTLLGKNDRTIESLYVSENITPLEHMEDLF